MSYVTLRRPGRGPSRYPCVYFQVHSSTAASPCWSLRTSMRTSGSDHHTPPLFKWDEIPRSSISWVAAQVIIVTQNWQDAHQVLQASNVLVYEEGYSINKVIDGPGWKFSWWFFCKDELWNDIHVQKSIFTGDYTILQAKITNYKISQK